MTYGITIKATPARSAPSALQAAARDALDDAALKDEEQNDERQRPENRGRLDVGEALAERPLHGGQSYRNRHELGIREHKQWEDQVVPDVNKGDDRDGSDHRPGQRQHDRPIDPPRSGTVDASRFLEVTRDRKSTRLNSSHANLSYAVFCL